MQKYRIDGILWYLRSYRNHARAVPLCPNCNLEMSPPNIYKDNTDLKCEDCEKKYKLPREFREEEVYALRKIRATAYREMDVLNLDDEAIPLAKDKISSKNNKYFVKSVLTKSKVGLRLIVYAGEKGKKEKAQIFVEPVTRRLSFDQSNLHPTDIFTKLVATFHEGTCCSVERDLEKRKKENSNKIKQ